jgi:hypothetical protein
MAMLRKTMIAFFAIASVGLLAPDVASARGGFGGGGGGFHGVGGGGFHAGGFGGGGFRSAAIGGGAFRSAAIGVPGAAVVSGGGFRSGPLAANAFAPRAFGANGWRGGGFHHEFHHGRRFAFGAFAAGVGLGLYGPYGYYGDYDYPYYEDTYYDDSGCYIVQQRVLTPYGWRLRPVQVCD